MDEADTAPSMLDRAKELSAQADDREEIMQTVEERLTAIEAWIARQQAAQKICKAHFWVPFGQVGAEVVCIRCEAKGPKGTKPSRVER